MNPENHSCRTTVNEENKEPLFCCFHLGVSYQLCPTFQMFTSGKNEKKKTHKTFIAFPLIHHIPPNSCVTSIYKKRYLGVGIYKTFFYLLFDSALINCLSSLNIHGYQQWNKSLKKNRESFFTVVSKLFTRTTLYILHIDQ